MAVRMGATLHAIMLSASLSAGLGGLLMALGALAISLASPGQALLARPWPAGVWLLGVLCLALSLACLFPGRGAPAAIATWAVWLMLSFMLAPCLGLLRRTRR